ncbi:MAG: zinc finger domain-containing protein, partial [Alphaproteobacteria bacterium]
CEALWRARLSPDRPAATLLTPAGRVSARAVRLTAALRAVLTEAITAGGSSLRDHIGATGELGAFQTRLAVYDRRGAPCPRPSCRGIVRRVSHGGRSTFHCAKCQR